MDGLTCVLATPIFNSARRCGAEIFLTQRVALG